MKILISGATGFIGSALSRHLRAGGHDVYPLRRRINGSPPAPWWDPSSGQIQIEAPGLWDAVVHLAGENIAGRWTAEKKRRLHDSRVKGTDLLARAVTALGARPRVFVSASATGWYGDRGDAWVDERSPSGDGFLAEICRAWEQAATPAVAAGIRAVWVRLGLVLGRNGGALAKMLPAFRLGLGGSLGTGRQWWSWVTIDDVVRAIACAIENTTIAGPVNVVAPSPVTNREFTACLGRVLGRPVFMRVPAFALRAIFGREMANETFLASVRVRPGRLQQLGFEFQHPTLEAGLRAVL